MKNSHYEKAKNYLNTKLTVIQFLTKIIIIFHVKNLEDF